MTNYNETINDQVDICELQREVSVIKRDIYYADRQCERMSKNVAESIENLKELNISVNKMISIHEEKHQQHEKTQTELKESIKELNTRINTVNREMNEKMCNVEDKISGKIDDLRDDILKAEIVKPQTEDKKGIIDTFKGVDKTVWMLMGGLLTIIWVISNIEKLEKVFNMIHN